MYDVNFLAIFIAAIAAMILGAFWYSPLLFGKQWITLLGLSGADQKAMKKKAGAAYAGGFVVALVKAFVLALFLNLANDLDLTQALLISFWAWLGFSATIEIGSVLWENKSIKLFVLNTAYNLINFLLMGFIINSL